MGASIKMNRLEIRYNELSEEERDGAGIFSICETLNMIKNGSTDGYSEETIERYKSFLNKCIETWDEPSNYVDEIVKELILETLNPSPRFPFLEDYRNDCCYALCYREYLEGRLESALSKIDDLQSVLKQSGEVRESELTQEVRKLKMLLDENGEYSICRSDKNPMGWADLMTVGNVLENLSKLIT